MKIYMVHPISGLSAETVFNYYKKNQKRLEAFGYQVLTPMYGKGFLRCEKEFRSSDYKNPCTTNHAIFDRDHWMVEQADVLYANLSLANMVSIGSMMELAWGKHLHKHIVLTLPEINVHRHAFVLEAASVIYTEHEESMEYLRMLVQGEY